MRLLDRLVDWWMARCPHNSDDVAFDILEGAMDGLGSGEAVSLCRRCGAIRFVFAGKPGAWRRPRPMWAEPYNTRSMIADAKKVKA